MNRIKKLFARSSNTIQDWETFDSEDTTATPSISYDPSIQNFRLIWLDDNTDANNVYERVNIITKLWEVGNTVHRFIDIDECIDFVTNIEDDNIFMIIAGKLGQTAIPIIHDLDQINSFYIFYRSTEQHEEWTNEWPKINGVFTQFIPMYLTLKKVTTYCDRNAVSISFFQNTDENSNIDLNVLDRSFIYLQILKEILSTIDFEQKHIDDFLIYCREKLLVDDIQALQIVDEIEQYYHEYNLIWWYTHPCFLYSVLNKALRTMEIERIIKMSFFIRDLQKHIAKLHNEQYVRYHHANTPLIIYRGQGLSQTEFDQLQKTQGGLLSFNNFLSTSKEREVAAEFVRSIMQSSDLMGVLFIIKIDLSIHSTPFANVRDVSYHTREEEILFSLHSVFRIGEIKQIDGTNDRLWEVQLTLTNDKDCQLNALTECIRKETFSTKKEWYRLSNLLVTLGEFDKAEQVYDALLQETTNIRERASIYQMLGKIKCDQGKYNDAIDSYKKLDRISKTIFHPADLHWASLYDNIGEVCNKIGQYSEALSSHRKALKIKRKILLKNDPLLAQSCNNIGSVLDNLSKYSEAVLYHEEALKIRQRNLAPNDPDLAQSYNSIGSAYHNMGKYSKAIASFEKAIEINEKILSPKDFSLGKSYKKVGILHENIRQYSEALLFYNKALNIFEDSLPANHHCLTSLQKIIERVNKKL